MKKGILLFVMGLLAVSLIAQEQKEVVTGAVYADDVYYSLVNGSVTTVARDNWDIAFTTQVYSISILANNGAGVELYTYSLGDTTDWANLDTTGMTWTPMYNSLETFDEGAFSAHALVHPDYGWGIYGGMGLITGDSLFVIKTVSGVYKKLAIIRKVSSENRWEFKYANLDGSDEQFLTINTGEYATKNFIYYSIDNQVIADREPATADWDLLFTKYYDYTIPYIVTAVLSNDDHVVAQEVKEDGLDQSTFTSFEDSSFSSVISIIGSDWKSFNMDTYVYDVAEDVVYFIKKYVDQDSTYYKLYFTGFTGMSEGKYTFMQEELLAVSTEIPGSIQMLEVYPNPASDFVNVAFDHMGEVRMNIIDISGRSVYSVNHDAGGFSSLRLDISVLNSGLYFIKVDTGNEARVLRFIKE
ncbi:MAG: T9SS type A sorting domain-containing protein [Bacteroidales bacterium]|nr:T9SS type A sorting domain-containing protein [Bacteroidales bacterium]